jgi:hypothetical protein
MRVPVRDKGSGNRGKGKSRHISVNGYVIVYDQRRAGTAQSGALEHRLVMERLLNRPLLSEEHVHHRNGVKTDNRPENLELVTSRTHREKHTVPGRWLRYACCVECGTTERHHAALGLCTACYARCRYRRTHAK